MNKKCLETKTFTKMQNQQLFNKKDFFSFSNLLRFHVVNIKDFHSNMRATYTLNALQKLMRKDSFLATDATTQSSNQEENEKEGFFILFYCKITQQGKMLTRTKPRE
jgi:hypothetical protein